MDLEQVDLSQLMCRSIRVLAELIGLPETLKLIDARGGTTVKVPANAARATALLDILTLESVEKLCAVYGSKEGKELLVPKKDKVTQQLRNLAIKAARQDMSGSKVAMTFGITRRHVINIAKAEPDERQDDLFGF